VLGAGTFAGAAPRQPRQPRQPLCDDALTAAGHASRATAAKFWVPLRSTEGKHRVQAPLAVLSLLKQAEAKY